MHIERSSNHKGFSGEKRRHSSHSKSNRIALKPSKNSISKKREIDPFGQKQTTSSYLSRHRAKHFKFNRDFYRNFVYDLGI